MHEYKFILNNGLTIDFKSQFQITQIQPIIIGGLTFAHFTDSGHTINMNQIKELFIDGIKHQVKSYQV